MKKIGQILIEKGYITAEQLETALARQSELQLPIGKILLEMECLADEELAEALSLQWHLPYCKPVELNIEPSVLVSISPRQAERFQVIPIALQAGRLTLATADLRNIEAIDIIRETLQYQIKLAIASETQIAAALKKYYGTSLESVAAVLEDLNESELSPYRNQVVSEVSHIAPETMTNEAPIIRLVNTIIAGAIKLGASDIHLEPFDQLVKVRYRVDGVLQETHSPPKNLYQAVISRIKLMAGMDITERRIPQDGRIRIQLLQQEIDLRVAVAPTLFGEAAVLRILNRQSILLSLDQLGLSAQNLTVFSNVIHRPHGMILVTGPTGSGKTTTLYGALQKLNESFRKIITIEDPIEYQLQGVNQMQVNPKVDFTFAQGLRTVVRHDPDIILVGEIRDRETAEVAIQSALTGHLVLATLHTNDASSAFTRLIDMGIEEFLVASTVRGVLAQRLVRKLCPHCKMAYTITDQERELLGGTQHDDEFYHSEGCDQCNQIGYRGQIGLFEMLETTEEIERLIMERSSSSRIRETAIRQGMVTLRADGLQKIKSGITSLAEVLRVTQD